ncbi:hypothetical protein [Microtetraspora niveoalba]|uniref:hypothetical protein n=1 Tax=Microtetraspora niveoalba TaxID=46175 RepID=UPI0008354665|nr:hypothetical protein [Microtetraspora niveoalba]
MTSTSTEALAGTSGGGLPTPAPALPRRSAQITVTTRDGDRVTVSTWSTCAGVGDFVSMLLGEPGSRVEVDHA